VRVGAIAATETVEYLDRERSRYAISAERQRSWRPKPMPMAL
jgi:hypothetical protein